MKSDIAGYIVTDEYDYTLRLYDGILWMHEQATLFPTYGAARTAARRTKTYARNKGYRWGQVFRIRRVEFAKVTVLKG